MNKFGKLFLLSAFLPISVLADVQFVNFYKPTPSQFPINHIGIDPQTHTPVECASGSNSLWGGSVLTSVSWAPSGINPPGQLTWQASEGSLYCIPGLEASTESQIQYTFQCSSSTCNYTLPGYSGVISFTAVGPSSFTYNGQTYNLVRCGSYSADITQVVCCYNTGGTNCMPPQK